MDYLQDSRISKFITNHRIIISSFEYAQMMNADIHYQRNKDKTGWEILLMGKFRYPSYWGSIMVILALGSMYRKDNPWYKHLTEKDFQDGFESRENSFENRVLINLRPELDNSINFLFEIQYLLNNGYLENRDIISLINYFLSDPFNVRIICQAMALTVVISKELEVENPVVQLLIKEKQYHLLPILDRFKEILVKKEYDFNDLVFVFNRFMNQLRDTDLKSDRFLRLSTKWMSNTSEEYHDIAISFAGEDRNVAETIALKLKENNINVFYDEFQKAELLGKNLFEHLTEIYRKHSQFCLMIISKNYIKKPWTKLENRAVQAAVFDGKEDYILPLRLDDTEVPGLLPTVGYVDFRSTQMDELISILVKKVKSNREVFWV